MTILFYFVGILILVWGVPKMIRRFRGAKEEPGGRRVGWKIDKKAGKVYGLYLVAGKLEERDEEDVILDTSA
jgi:uncharacterized membrane protein HdeD (DUF308 family)